MKIEPHLEAMLAQVELRVLYGPQAGSRLPLSPGTYLLGTGDECSVMLAGPRMRESHASLDFDGETPSVTPIDGDVFDAQGNELQGTLALRLGMPIELGGVWIAIDHVDATWPDPEEVAAIAGLASPPPEPEAPTEAETSAKNERVSDQPANHHRRSWNAATAPIAIVAMLGVMAFAMTAWLVHGRAVSGDTDEPASASSAPDATLELQENLARVAPGQRISVTQDADGVLRVSGYAREPASRDRIVAAVRKFGNTTPVVIHVDSELLIAARKVVEKLADPRKMKVNIIGVTNGRVEITGTVSSAAIRESLTERLRSDVPGIAAVTGRLLTSEDLPSLLEDRMLAAGLTGKLQVIERHPEFVVRGRLGEPDLVQWERLLANFGNEYANLLPIRATIIVAYRKPPVDVQMVVGGSMPFIVTESGQRIGRGGDANGHTLSTVGEQEVIFDGNERFKIAR